MLKLILVNFVNIYYIYVQRMVHCMRTLNDMFITDHNDHNLTLIPNRDGSIIDDIIKGYLFD